MNGIESLTVTPDGHIIIASPEGAFSGRNLGTRWDRMQLGLPSKKINSVTYDGSNQRLLATTADSTEIFESRDGGHSWRRDLDTGYPLRQLSLAQGRLVAATRFEGLVLPPR